MTPEDLVKRNEGLRLKLYPCTGNPPRLTVGYGRNIQDNGISVDEAELMLQNDVTKCIEDLADIFPGMSEWKNERLIALVDMRYNLGPGGFRGFKKMIAAIKADDWELAAKEAIDSDWAAQVGLRANRDAELLRGLP